MDTMPYLSWISPVVVAVDDDSLSLGGLVCLALYQERRTHAFFEFMRILSNRKRGGMVAANKRNSSSYSNCYLPKCSFTTGGSFSFRVVVGFFSRPSGETCTSNARFIGGIDR